MYPLDGVYANLLDTGDGNIFSLNNLAEDNISLWKNLPEAQSERNVLPWDSVAKRWVTGMSLNKSIKLLEGDWLSKLLERDSCIISSSKWRWSLSFVIYARESIISRQDSIYKRRNLFLSGGVGRVLENWIPPPPPK